MKRTFQTGTSSTSQSFWHHSQPTLAEDTHETSTYEVDVEELKAMVQAEVFNSLLSIKGEIESKIKQIDRQIKDIREGLHELMYSYDSNKVAQLEERQKEISDQLRQVIIQSERLPLSRNDSRRSIERSGYLNQSRERPSSKQRKPIFSKPEGNLSTLLFPFARHDESVEIKPQSSLHKSQEVLDMAQHLQELNSLIINDVNEQPFEIPRLSPRESPALLVDQSLVKNRTRFLKNKTNNPLQNRTVQLLDEGKFGIIHEESIEESIVIR